MLQEMTKYGSSLSMFSAKNTHSLLANIAFLHIGDEVSMKKRKESTYGPDLTDRQKADLIKEIVSLDCSRMLRDIEKSSVHKQAYTYTTDDKIIDERNTREIDWSRPKLDKDVEMAKFEIDSILSYRQKQVWHMCMRQGMTHDEVATKLHIRRQAVQQYLYTAEQKIKAHFEVPKNDEPA